MANAPPPNHGYTDSAVSDVADVGKTLISGITPAEKGWILGFIVIVGFVCAVIIMITKWYLETTTESNTQITEYLIKVEENRSEALERQAAFFADQVRRSQEVIRALAEAVARDSERAGMAAMTAIDRESVSQYATPIPEGALNEKLP